MTYSHIASFLLVHSFVSFFCWQAVGLYPTNSSAVNEFILQDSRADVIVVEDEKQVSVVNDVNDVNVVKFLCEA